MAVVQPIPEDVSEKLSAGYRISSMCQCIEELIFNSIDANATSIAIRIDLDKYKIQVVDKGEGIEPANMQILGEKFNTNRNENGSKFGNKGEVLAAIVELSKACIVESVTSSSNITVRKQFLNGKVSSLKKCKLIRTCSGTTVTIQNLFHKLPVRQKQHRREIELERIVRKITELSICHSHISFSLRNECDSKILVQTRRTDSSAKTFQALFSASYSHDLIECINREIKLALLSVELYLGPKSFRNSSLQFVFVNGRPVVKTRLHRIIQEQILILTKNSSDWVYIFKIFCPKNLVEIFDSDDGDTFVHFKMWNEIEDLVSHLIKTSFLGKSDKNFVQETSLSFSTLKQSPNEREMGNVNRSDVVRSKIVKNSKTTFDCLINTLPAEIAESLEDAEAVAETTNPTVVYQKELSKNFVNESLCLSRIQPTWGLTDKYESKFGNGVANLGIWTALGDDAPAKETVCLNKFEVAKKVDGLRITKDSLPFVKVINQLEKKFIICSLKKDSKADQIDTRTMNCILVFDQHAVSERIYLENLLSEDGLATTVAKSKLKDPVSLSTDLNEIQFLFGFLDKFEKFGISFAERRKSPLLQVVTVPFILLMKESSDLKHLHRSRMKSDLQSLISQINEALRNTKGVLSNCWIPKCLLDIMIMIACRSAIKFGDILTKEDCEKLLHQLSKCQNPFECAHGRPSVAPIADIGCFYL